MLHCAGACGGAGSLGGQPEGKPSMCEWAAQASVYDGCGCTDRLLTIIKKLIRGVDWVLKGGLRSRAAAWLHDSSVVET